VATNRNRGIWLWLVVLFGAIFLISPVIDLFQRTQTGDGTRTGVVVKLSYKGRFHRSWEGDLMLGGVQSGQLWAFSLDPGDSSTASLAQAIQAAELSAKPVTLSYHQHFIAPWHTDTNYLVYQLGPSGSTVLNPESAR
jgi:hypothetical protein